MHVDIKMIYIYGEDIVYSIYTPLSVIQVFDVKVFVNYYCCN